MMTRPSTVRIAIVLALTLSGMAAGVWARQPRGGDDIRTIDVTASRFKFEPATISVVEGDRVRLRVRSADRSHGIGIKAFRVKTVIPEAGDVVSVEFVANHAGAFDITCSEYCGTRHSAMKGRLIVVAREK